MAWLRFISPMRKIDLAEATSRKTAEDYDRCTYGPFLRLSSPSRLAAVTILATTLFGDGLRDALDPTLKGR